MKKRLKYRKNGAVKAAQCFLCGSVVPTEDMVRVGLDEVTITEDGQRKKTGRVHVAWMRKIQGMDLLLDPRTVVEGPGGKLYFVTCKEV